MRFSTLKQLLPAFALSFGMVASSWAAPTVEMQTNMGRIVIELDSAKAPQTVENFMQNVNSGFYTNTIFHRVIDGFMVQGGGLTKDMSEKPSPKTIQNEANNGLKNKRGTIAMARRMEPHSAGSQFFINLVDNTPLDFTSEQNGRTWGYAVFGKVTEGMEVVDKIAKVKTSNKNGHQNVPIDTIVIESVKQIPEKK